MEQRERSVHRALCGKRQATGHWDQARSLHFGLAMALITLQNAQLAFDHVASVLPDDK